MLFFVGSKVQYRYSGKRSRIIIIFMNIIWLLSFLTATTIAFLPILPNSLFVGVVDLIPFDLTNAGIITSLVGILLFLIYALVGLVFTIKRVLTSKIKHLVAFFFALAIPFGLAFSLAKVLSLPNSAIFLLTSTFMYISYIAVCMVRFKSYEPDIEESEEETLQKVAEMFVDTDSVSDNDIVVMRRVYHDRRARINKVNEQRKIKRKEAINKTIDQCEKVINFTYIIYVVIAVALTILISLPSLTDQIAKIWSSIIIYGPAIATIVKILSSIFVMVRKKTS